ncbi:LysE family translocator [Geomesophilobacter sediminis]|uniref:LysE family translocator n=1 Tax=Geomesophilobacter sediminis TaxID=2798584 RepID=A0A8J7JKZ5_9BACT|nr:LysE family translocator [Geomesophilobacter sediminis]MBJ6724340.1 LysE family translocator [Geomesophilobacter sediminis]
MFGIHNYVGFITAILLFQLAPGPGSLAILHATARGGKRAGLGAVFGTLAGDLVFMLAAVSGLAAVLAANPRLFAVLQWGGIAYLCRFGFTLLRAGSAAAEPDGGTATGTAAAFRQAFRIGLTNPKAIMFFMAFFPLFLTADSRPLTLGILMVHVSLVCFLYQVCLVCVGDSLARRLSGQQRLRQVALRCAGAGLIGFSAKLGLQR